MNRNGPAPLARSGVHVAVAVSARTGWAGVMVSADAEVVVIDADQARQVARSLTLAAEEADRENHPDTDPDTHRERDPS